MSGPRRLRSLLAAWIPANAALRRSLGADEATAALGAAWEKAVGDEVARRSRPSKFHHGVLTVLTASSAWSDELSLHAPRIVEALRQAIPDVALVRLRFVVATGRTRALLEVDRRTHHTSLKTTQSQRSNAPASQTMGRHFDEELSPLGTVEALAKQQVVLNASRDRAGWLTCSQCGRRFPPQAQPSAICSVCAHQRTAAQHSAIERALMHAPWLSLEEIRRALPGTTPTAYERTKARLLARWQADSESAQRRLRRGATTAEDRVVAWSYCMLVAGKPQSDIGRAVVEGTLGRDWMHVLFGDELPQKREAARSRREKQKS